ncbi:MAG: spermidine synthase [Acidobacteriia bacterium]|nr:spermidine synthase [Terriglobia bacterium]
MDSEQASTRSVSRWAWVVPIATVFVSSLCIMVLELVAGRLIARHVGSSLYTWTSVIGIVLSGIAAGNYIGGRLADRFPPKETLSLIFLVASANCLLIPVLNNRIGGMEFLRELEWPVRIALHVFLVFFAPSCLLGMISPSAAKMAIVLGQRLGRTIGNVYSWGAIGSILGTFLTGYVLIAEMGTTAVLLSVAGVLLLIALLYGGASLLPYLWTGVLIAVMFAAWAPFPWARVVGERLGYRELRTEAVLYHDESQYSVIRVEEVIETAGLRSMTLDHLVHAYVDLNDPDNLHYDYERVYAGITNEAVRAYHPDQEVRALFLGGGGYVFPRWFLRNYPRGIGEVVEIDPQVTRAAFDAFDLEPDTPLRIGHMDARNRIDELFFQARRGALERKFDLVYNDAFNHYSPPFHLTTLEYVRKLRAVMSDDSVFLANTIDVFRSGRFLGAMINTVEQVFPYVYTFGTSPGGPTDEDERDTFVVVGSTRLLPVQDLDYVKYAADLLSPQHTALLRERSHGLVLTDDYAPVDNMLAPVIRLVERQ